MKKLAAILVFVVLLFNIYGYRLVISCMQYNSEAELEKQVDDNNYDETQLFSIKTKLDLPYFSGSAAFERAYGSVTIEGNQYQYVKRRVHNDTLELLCIPNEIKTKLQSVKNELAKTFADAQSPTPKKNTIIKIIFPDFFQVDKSFSALCLTSPMQTGHEYKTFLSGGFIFPQRKPPRVLNS